MDIFTILQHPVCSWTSLWSGISHLSTHLYRLTSFHPLFACVHTIYLSYLLPKYQFVDSIHCPRYTSIYSFLLRNWYGIISVPYMCRFYHYILYLRSKLSVIAVSHFWIRFLPMHLFSLLLQNILFRQYLSSCIVIVSISALCVPCRLHIAPKYQRFNL